jgi:hypothetical protein
MVGTASSTARISGHDLLCHPDVPLEPKACHQSCRGTKTHSPSTSCGTRTVEDVMTGRDVASVLRHWGQRRSEATCMMHVSQSIFGCQAMSSCTMAKPSLSFGWRTTSLCVGQAGRTRTCLSSSSSPFI